MSQKYTQRERERAVEYTRNWFVCLLLRYFQCLVIVQERRQCWGEPPTKSNLNANCGCCCSLIFRQNERTSGRRMGKWLSQESTHTCTFYNVHISAKLHDFDLHCFATYPKRIARAKERNRDIMKKCFASTLIK